MDGRAITSPVNGRKSRGPATTTNSSGNALKEGFFAKSLRPARGEKPEDLEALRLGIFHHFTPEGTLEQALAFRITFLIQRVLRLQRAEVGIYSIRAQGASVHERDTTAIAFLNDMVAGGRTLAELVSIEQKTERALYRAVGELERLQAKRTQGESPCGLI